jgi:hypothetical protein
MWSEFLYLQMNFVFYRCGNTILGDIKWLNISTNKNYVSEVETLHYAMQLISKCKD